MTNALVCGFGSIGQRHVRLLREMGLDVYVYSRRSLSGEKRFPDLSSALTETQPEYVVIANETSEHLTALKTALAFGVPKILVEKPLFTVSEILPKAPESQVCVAYNLRFHPLIQFEL